MTTGKQNATDQYLYTTVYANMNPLVSRSASPAMSINNSAEGSLELYAESNTSAAFSSLFLDRAIRPRLEVPPQDEVTRWSPSQVAHWFQHSVGIEEQYANQFIEHEVDGQTLLLDIDETCIREDLDIKKLGIRKRIYRAILTLRQQLMATSYTPTMITPSVSASSASVSATSTMYQPAKRQRLNTDIPNDRFWSNNDVATAIIPILSNISSDEPGYNLPSHTSTPSVVKDKAPILEGSTTRPNTKDRLISDWLPYKAIEDPFIMDANVDDVNETASFQFIARDMPHRYLGYNVYVQSRMKRYLRGRISVNKQTDLPEIQNRFRAVVVDPTEDHNDTNNECTLEDDVLPLYGESDYSDTELDEAYEDIEDNSGTRDKSNTTLPAAESECNRNPRIQLITLERKREIIKEYSNRLLEKWQSKRLTVLEKQKYSLYKRKSNIITQIHSELKYLLTKRLPTMIDTISNTAYTTEKAITTACGALDRTLFYIYDLSWKVGLLALPEAPLKPVRTRKKATSTSILANDNSNSTTVEKETEEESESDNLSDFIDDSELNPDDYTSLRNLMSTDNNDSEMLDSSNEPSVTLLLDELIQLPTFQLLDVPTTLESHDTPPPPPPTITTTTTTTTDNEHELVDLSLDTDTITSNGLSSSNSQENDQVTVSNSPQYVSISSSSSRSSSPIISEMRADSPPPIRSPVSSMRRVSRSAATPFTATSQRSYSIKLTKSQNTPPTARNTVAPTVINPPGHTSTASPSTGSGLSNSSGIGSLPYNNIETFSNWTEEVAERTIRNCRCARTRIPTAIRRAVRNYLDLPGENLFSRIENLARWSAFQGNTFRPPGSYSNESVNDVDVPLKWLFHDYCHWMRHQYQPSDAAQSLCEKKSIRSWLNVDLFRQFQVWRLTHVDDTHTDESSTRSDRR
ncbi:hypothetical protein BDF22DRAFT_688275 [Syncephalis plumigaleata]|nr:hypothetical protein BDF22DRAFT_688275 [Syncephalis plumigaleata]